MNSRQHNMRKKAFKILFSKALKITNRPQVTVIYDEEFKEYFNPLSEVIEELFLPVTYIFIPIRYQLLLQERSHFSSANGVVPLPNGIKAALSNSEIVLNMLHGNINTSMVRGAILSQEKPFNCKVVHCPGISDEILNLVSHSPYKRILDQSEMMAWALGNANQALLISKGRDGMEYELHMQLGGWDNEPFMSSGIIFEGSWGNVPPGETFCCPDPALVNGRICINGSVPNVVLRKGEEIILTFEKGKMTEWETKTGSQGDCFLHQLKKEGAARKDSNWNTFAELGIGLNPAIKSLTGNSLFDEKVAGTIHVAIGDNLVFGHSVKSHIHVDMVTDGPTLFLEDRKVIDDGQVDMSVIKAWKNNIKYKDLAVDKAKVINIDSAKIKITDVCLLRRFENGDRVGMVEILNNKYKKVLQNIKGTFESATVVKFHDLARKVGPGQRKQLIKVLSILDHYKVIEIK